MTLSQLVRAALDGHHDGTRAGEQQAYMKSPLPFRGISVPEVRRLVRSVMNEEKLESFTVWQATILELWDSANYREDWYAALTLARHRYYRPYRRDKSALALYQHLVCTGRWWDVVDEIAQHLVGDLLTAHRDDITEHMRTWAAGDDPWLRRAAILSQNRHRHATDPALLAHVVEVNINESDVFLRKAIGWSLRSYAEVDSQWVQHFLATHPSLSQLSRREASKHLPVS